MPESQPLIHVPNSALSDQTPQTEGMLRTEAISQKRTGSSAVWMGRTVVAPRTTSGPHHHGESETAIYVVSGRPVFRFSERGQERALQTEPGDFVFVPPFARHIEDNPNDEEAVVVIARSTQEPVVENVESL